MRIFSPQRNQQCILHNTGRSGRALMLAVIFGLVVALQAPLDAAEQPSQGGTIVWAVHEGMPDFDIHYQGTYIVAQPISPIYNGLLTSICMTMRRLWATWPRAGRLPRTASR